MRKRIFSLLLILCLVVGMLPMPVYADEQYSDIHGHWAESSIERWSNYAIVSGYNGKFSPNDSLTRAQMAVILTNILGLTEESEDCPFDDVKDTDWFAPYIKKCYAAGIMLGSNGKVNPNAFITRQEAVVMLCRTLNIKPCDTNELSVFLDDESVAEYAAPYLVAMVKAGVIKGDDKGNVLPTGMLTRGAIMAILDRSVVQYINKPGTYELVDKNGIILVASNGVTLTGNTNADLIISAGASDGKITFEKAKIMGSMTIQANNTTVDSKNSTLPKAEILGEGSKINNIIPNSERNNNSSGGHTTPAIQDLVVTESGTYSNATYRNVTIAESVGDGHVEFNNITITGNIVVNGCGSNTVHFKNCDIFDALKIDVAKPGGERPRLEFTHTTPPDIILQSPTIIESKDKTSKIQNIIAYDNLEVRGPDTIIENITAMKHSDTTTAINVLDGKIKNVISYTQLLMQGVDGRVDKITALDNIELDSKIVSKLFITEDASPMTQVNILTPTGESSFAPLDFGIEINSNKGVEITANPKVLGDISISTNLNETPSNVFVNKVLISHIHSWDLGVVVTKEPTCTETGIKTCTCSVSNCTYDSGIKTEDIPALGHSWDNGKVTKEPTCTEQGIKTYTCTRKDCTGTKTEDIAALGHSWDNGKITKEPTCTNTGIKTYTCTNEGCDGTKTENIAALGHTSEVIPAKAATCTEKGLTEGFKCSVCQEILVAQEATDHLGHNWESVTTPATCTTAGKIEKSCTRCDATEEKVIPIKDHNFTGNYYSNADGHWQKCYDCDTNSESIPHEFSDVECESVRICNICEYEPI